MGAFFTSMQIYNPNLLDREKFIDFFCEEMKKNGYVISIQAMPVQRQQRSFRNDTA